MDEQKKQELYKLLEDFKSGDTSVFDEIYHRCYKHVAFVSSKLSQNQQDVEEIVQDTFLTIYNNPQKIVPASFMGLLRKIAAYRSYDKLRQQKDWVNIDDYLEYTPEEKHDTDFLPEAYLQNKEKQVQILSLINDLSPKQRDMIYLYYYADINTEEIARLQNTTPGAVRKALHAARTKLKAKLDITGTALGGGAIGLGALIAAEESLFVATYVGTAVFTAGAAGAVATTATAATTTTAATTAAIATKTAGTAKTIAAAIGATAVATGVAAAVYVGVFTSTDSEPAYEIIPHTVAEAIVTEEIIVEAIETEEIAAEEVANEEIIPEEIVLEEITEPILEETLEDIVPPAEPTEPSDPTPSVVAIHHVVDHPTAPEIIREDILAMDYRAVLEDFDYEETEYTPPTYDTINFEDYIPTETMPEVEAEIQAPPPITLSLEDIFSDEPADRTDEILAALAGVTTLEGARLLMAYYGFLPLDTVRRSTNELINFYTVDEGSGNIIVGIKVCMDTNQWDVNFEFLYNRPIPDSIDLFRWM